MKRQYRSGDFDILLVDGKPPCDPPDDCIVCRLFDHQRPTESRAAWLDRVTRYGIKRDHLEVSA